jgi:hypothetical protein
MTPVDRATLDEKEELEWQEDLRHEWMEEDIRAEGRLPNLEELEGDTEIL